MLETVMLSTSSETVQNAPLPTNCNKNVDPQKRLCDENEEPGNVPVPPKGSTSTLVNIDGEQILQNGIGRGANFLPFVYSVFDWAGHRISALAPWMPLQITIVAALSWWAFCIYTDALMQNTIDYSLSYRLTSSHTFAFILVFCVACSCFSAVWITKNHYDFDLRPGIVVHLILSFGCAIIPHHPELALTAGFTMTWAFLSRQLHLGFAYVSMLHLVFLFVLVVQKKTSPNAQSDMVPSCYRFSRLKIKSLVMLVSDGNFRFRSGCHMFLKMLFVYPNCLPSRGGFLHILLMIVLGSFAMASPAGHWRFGLTQLGFCLVTLWFFWEGLSDFNKQSVAALKYDVDAPPPFDPSRIVKNSAVSNLCSEDQVPGDLKNRLHPDVAEKRRQAVGLSWFVIAATALLMFVVGTCIFMMFDSEWWSFEALHAFLSLHLAILLKTYQPISVENYCAAEEQSPLMGPIMFSPEINRFLRACFFSVGFGVCCALWRLRSTARSKFEKCRWEALGTLATFVLYMIRMLHTSGAEGMDFKKWVIIPILIEGLYKMGMLPSAVRILKILILAFATIVCIKFISPHHRGGITSLFQHCGEHSACEENRGVWLAEIAYLQDLVMFWVVYACAKWFESRFSLGDQSDVHQHPKRSEKDLGHLMSLRPMAWFSEDATRKLNWCLLLFFCVGTVTHSFTNAFLPLVFGWNARLSWADAELTNLMGLVFAFALALSRLELNATLSRLESSLTGNAWYAMRHVVNNGLGFVFIALMPLAKVTSPVVLFAFALLSECPIAFYDSFFSGSSTANGYDQDPYTIQNVLIVITTFVLCVASLCHDDETRKIARAPIANAVATYGLSLVCIVCIMGYVVRTYSTKSGTGNFPNVFGSCNSFHGTVGDTAMCFGLFVLLLVVAMRNLKLQPAAGNHILRLASIPSYSIGLWWFVTLFLFPVMGAYGFASKPALPMMVLHNLLEGLYCFSELGTAIVAPYRNSKSFEFPLLSRLKFGQDHSSKSTSWFPIVMFMLSAMVLISALFDSSLRHAQKLFFLSGLHLDFQSFLVSFLAGRDRTLVMATFSHWFANFFLSALANVLNTHLMYPTWFSQSVTLFHIIIGYALPVFLLAPHAMYLVLNGWKHICWNWNICLQSETPISPGTLDQYVPVATSMDSSMSHQDHGEAAMESCRGNNLDATDASEKGCSLLFLMLSQWMTVPLWFAWHFGSLGISRNESLIRLFGSLGITRNESLIGLLFVGLIVLMLPISVYWFVRNTQALLFGCRHQVTEKTDAFENGSEVSLKIDVARSAKMPSEASLQKPDIESRTPSIIGFPEELIHSARCHTDSKCLSTNNTEGYKISDLQKTLMAKQLEIALLKRRLSGIEKVLASMYSGSDTMSPTSSSSTVPTMCDAKQRVSSKQNVEIRVTEFKKATQKLNNLEPLTVDMAYEDQNSTSDV